MKLATQNLFLAKQRNGDPSVYVLDTYITNLQSYLGVLATRVKNALADKGIHVESIVSSIEYDPKEDLLRYGFTIEVPLKEVFRVYYESLYELCTSNVNEAIARGEVSEDRAEEEVEKCVEEKLREYDEEYGEPLFSLEFRNLLFSAKLIVAINDDSSRRIYSLALSIAYRNQVRPLYVPKQGDANYETALEYETETIVSQVEKLVRAVRELVE